MIGPIGQSCAHLGLVTRAGIGSADPGFMPRDVIEDRPHNVRECPVVGQPAGDSAPDVMQMPRGHWPGFGIGLPAFGQDCSVKSCLAVTPSAEAPSADAEDQIAAVMSRLPL